MNKFIHPLLVFFVMALLTSAVHAQIFDLNVTSYGSLGANTTFKNFVDAEILKVENKVNSDLPNAEPKRLMQGMANSSAMATKGVGTDYASHMDVFLVGASLGAGVDLEKQSNSDSDFSGVGVAPGVVVGTNLGFIGYNRWAMYVNFMSYLHKQKLSTKPGEESSAEIGMFTLGTHFRYNLIHRQGGKLLGWGGLKLHFGYDYNSTALNFKSTIRKTVNETSSSNEQIRGTIIGNPEAVIDVATHTIPLEISTDIQVLYLFSFYTGLGTDVNFGGAKGKANLNADESNLTCTGGACGAGEVIKVLASANINEKASVSPLFLRGFFGAQINLPYLRIYGQVNKNFGDDLIGVAAGARFVF